MIPMQLKFEFIQIMKIIVIIGLLLSVGFIYVRTKGKSNSDKTKCDLSAKPILKIGNIEVKIRTINKILLIIGGIPLLVYPFILLANVMMLAALFNGADIYSIIMSLLFVALTSSYLLTYILCWIFYFQKRDKSIFISTIPLIHVTVIIIVISL